MNIVSIPYHDWRKINKEGGRTRDSHFIDHFDKGEHIDNVILVNRPTSYVELLANRYSFGIEGELLLKRGGLKLYKISEKFFVIDYITNDIIRPVVDRKLWFFKSFAYQELVEFYKECLAFLGIEDPYIFSNNIFSIGFIENVKSDKVIFDAYDNLVCFPNNKVILNKLVDSYNRFVKAAACWTTNSTKNIAYYKAHYNQQNCFLVKNGVDIGIFKNSYPVPDDMMNIKRPIIGFGGKITHLFDTDLFNYCTDMHPDKSFVIVGQILDENVFNQINKSINVYYLGDKHYKAYPGYVCNFDVGIIPYVVNELESGVDSIKVYEYLAAGLNAIGTRGGGMPDLKEYLFIAKDKIEFSDFISDALKTTLKAELPKEHTWEYKTEYVLNLMKNIVPNAAV